VQTLPVAPPNHELAISTLDDGVAVLNRTTNVLTTVHGDQQTPVELPLTGPGYLPARIEGGVIPVTVPSDRHVYTVSGDGIQDFAVPGTGDGLTPAVAWQGRIYCADPTAGVVHVFGGDGRPTPSIEVNGARGPLDLEVRENYLFINAPDSSTARVVDGQHHVRVVDKYADDVLGGDPPATPPPTTPPSAPPKQKSKPKPRKPVVAKPSAPRNVTAAAGNAEARVSWRPANPNGAAVTRYVVRGAGQTFQVGANQRSLSVSGLTNGETYEFTVHAVNVKGAGPSRTSNPVRPTSEVPDPPGQVTADARPDGSVHVGWAAANGQGLKIKRYAVTAISDGGGTPIGDSDGTDLTIKTGELQYGHQYAFTVVSINQRGAGSKASPPSETVVPFTAPGRPESVDASTVDDKAGTIKVTWRPAPDNGRPITRYVVHAGDRSTTVSDGDQATLTGFGNGQNVAVQVRGVNEAGEGEAGTANAATVAEPTLRITGASATDDSVTISFTVDAGGGKATCSITRNGGGTTNGGCTSIKVPNLDPGTNYTFNVKARNAAGEHTVARAQETDPIYGIATCINGERGDTADYCDRDRPNERNGNEIFEVTRQDNSRQAGWVPNGTRLRTYCRASGEDVDSYIYNHQKQSKWWVRVDHNGRNYIPWAWLNLQGGDDIGRLPGC
jgi:hypothetical protein